MKERFRGYGLSEQDVREFVAAFLGANQDLYAAVRVRCVAVKTDHGWENGLLFAQAIPKLVQPEKAASLRYGPVRLLETWIDAPALPSLLDQIAAGIVDIDGDSVSFRVNRKFGEYQFLPGSNDYSSFSGYALHTDHTERVSVSNEPLLAYALPFYSDPYAAMRDWLGIRRFHDHSDARIGTALLFLPECRARFDGFQWTNGALHVSVPRMRSLETGLRVKGIFETEGIRCGFDLPVDKPIVRIDIPVLPDSIEIYLIGSDETVYDFRYETPNLALSRDRVLTIGLPQGKVESALRAALAHGEGDQVEFKPFVRPGDKKQDELLDTVIAFANTKGGTIFLGVNDHCVPVGIERDLEKIRRGTDGGRSPEEALQEYIGRLKQVISGALNKTVPLTIRSVVSDGHTLLIIQVPEGERKPYCHRDRKVVYVRRGASNMVADPDRDLPHLFQSGSSRIGGLWRRQR